jgi:hypothetical protein
MLMEARMELYYLSIAGKLTEDLCAIPAEPTDEMVIEQARAKAARLERAGRMRWLREALARALANPSRLRAPPSHDRTAH